MAYRVVEIFPTLQGEGAQAGTAAVFVRFAGCNLWTGESATRSRDAERNSARCPLWCDTDFRRGVSMSLEKVVAAVAEPGVPLVVFTGGEPLLQLDLPLCTALRTRGHRLAIETNGTVRPKEGVVTALDWICVSPKRPDADIVVRRGNELKLVFPAMPPHEYQTLAAGFEHRFVQPQARPGEGVGESVLDPEATGAAIEFCLRNPSWRLSPQTHKLIGIP